ncbi:MAG: lipoate--protein ligase [Bacillota bacterium]|nr:lipoate--protein ligase [Bacillota bacterium]
MPHALIVHATSHDPWFNLAFEAWLLEQLENGRYEAILYLWQNDQTVVIGRNQNAWAECKTGLLEAEGGKLARRSTGGGAVFHDLGNLNFSIVLPRKQFDTDRNFAMLLAALETQGIAAERSGRNDILADGLKFSGNAFSLRRQTGLHHGTLLVHSDYARVARYLTVSSDKLKGKGVTSVRSRITNLQAINPDITIPTLNQAMETTFCSFFCAGSDWQIERAADTHFRSDGRVQELFAHYASWTWRYGETLAFDAEISRRFDWGGVQVGFQVRKGHVIAARVYSDALDSDYISCLPDQLNGCRFHSVDLAAMLQAGCDPADELMTPRRKMADDIGDLILEQNW